LVASGELAQGVDVVYQTDHFVVSICGVASLNWLVKEIRRVVFDVNVEAERPAVAVICGGNDGSEDLLLILEVVWGGSPKEAVAFKIYVIWWLIDQEAFVTQI